MKQVGLIASLLVPKFCCFCSFLVPHVQLLLSQFAVPVLQFHCICLVCHVQQAVHNREPFLSANNIMVG